ncbi:nicotinamide/nicotinate riboside kinase [Pelomyxa schiedti]|nr:nicotinamide/nicotinate riboside kinase [Pelomyxa schiedti]
MASTRPRCDKCVYPIVVGISGPTRSGKSTLARSLATRYKSRISVPIIPMDCFFNENKIGKAHVKSQLRFPNWECPEAVDILELQLEIEHQVALSTKQCAECKARGTPPDSPVTKESRRWLRYKENWDVHRAEEPLSDERQIVLVEGFLLLIDNPVIYNFDKKIFLSANHGVCHDRRMSTTSVPESYFDAMIWPNYIKYNTHLKKWCQDGMDLCVIDATLSPNEVEHVAVEYIEGRHTIDHSESLKLLDISQVAHDFDQSLLQPIDFDSLLPVKRNKPSSSKAFFMLASVSLVILLFSSVLVARKYL